MRDFDRVASHLIPRRRLAHLFVGIVTLFLLVGLPVSMTPADIEGYNLESAEINAQRVIDDEFNGSGVLFGFIISLRQPAAVPAAPTPATVTEIIAYPGLGGGIESPQGGILNLSVLREIDRKTEAMTEFHISDLYSPLYSEVTGVPVEGVLSLSETFRDFMANRSRLTQPTVDLFGRLVPPATDWSDCGALECLTFDDPNITQAHIDLAAHRMANHSDGAFLRWLSDDRAFLPDPTSSVYGPVGGSLVQNGVWDDATWMPGRWSASSAWLLISLDHDAVQDAGWTFQWGEASQDWGYRLEGTGFVVDAPIHTSEQCLARVTAGEGACSVEWLFMSMQQTMRELDQQTTTLLVAESINVEVNRELYSSVWLLVLMGAAIVVLLWASLRRWSDVAIVCTGLVGSLVWMQGAIGWGIILGEGVGRPFIERSQFSNLLPILILALGIDDSLHVLHRYKEERRGGATPEGAAHTSVSRVGRAIMLTSLTTTAAFMANLFSDIPALRSFGIEAALGITSAFVLTGLWVPLVRLDVDLALRRRQRLREPRSDEINLVPAPWLAAITRSSGRFAPFVFLSALLITAIATPAMLSLEGDFKVEDFLDAESEFVVGVDLIDERFASEGEPATILIEGDMAHPAVLDAIVELRNNMDDISPEDPDKFSRDPAGHVKLIAIDEMLEASLYALMYDRTPYEAVGWNASLPDAGVNCPISGIGVPDFDDRGCITFFFGFMLTHGVPPSGGVPEISPGIAASILQAQTPIDPTRPWLDVNGDPAFFHRSLMQFGVRSADRFPLVELALAELDRDLAPFHNLTAASRKVRAPLTSVDDNHPLTWVIETGSPITRYIASTRMQGELQNSLGLGVLMCILALWWGFRPERQRAPSGVVAGSAGGLSPADATKQTGQQIETDETSIVELSPVVPSAVGLSTDGLSSNARLMAIRLLVSAPFIAASVWFIRWSDAPDWAFALLLALLLCGALFWGLRALALALLTARPLILVVVWLDGMIAAAGYGLNMVTVAIAAMSLGVGIDYVIHVVVRYREERHGGLGHADALTAVGAASGLALVGSAVSDMTGFLIISRSAMGFFASFGLFSAMMIGLSLIASMLLAPAALTAAEAVRRGRTVRNESAARANDE